MSIKIIEGKSMYQRKHIGVVRREDILVWVRDDSGDAIKIPQGLIGISIKRAEEMGFLVFKDITIPE